MCNRRSRRLTQRREPRMLRSTSSSAARQLKQKPRSNPGLYHLLLVRRVYLGAAPSRDGGGISPVLPEGIPPGWSGFGLASAGLAGPLGVSSAGAWVPGWVPAAAAAAGSVAGVSPALVPGVSWRSTAL